MTTKIEWTGKTWNPVTGCDKISEGCKNCYAMNMAFCLQHIPASAEKYAGTAHRTQGGAINWTGRINLVEKDLLLPLRWKKPTVAFVNSMSDLFHEDVPFDFIDKVFAVMALCPQHTFQILTKRAERMAEYFKSREDLSYIDEAADIIVCTEPHLFHILEKLTGEGKKYIGTHHITNELLPHLKDAGWLWDITYSEDGNDSELIYEGEWPLPNVWLGVSVENQKAADERISYLLQVPAAVRFLSCEPLLGPVDLSLIVHTEGNASWGFDALSLQDDEYVSQNNFNNKRIDWVIAGGESGRNARPMHPDWAKNLRDQCTAANVPFFFKQWGEWLPEDYVSDEIYSNTSVTVNPDNWKNFYDETAMLKVGKKAAGRLLDGREWNEMPKINE